MATEAHNEVAPTAEPASVGPTKDSNQEDCYFFVTEGLHCTKGDACEFRHSEAAKHTTQVCRHWLKGHCSNPACTFRHMQPKRGAARNASAGTFPPAYHAPAAAGGGRFGGGGAPVCKFFLQGTCTFGAQCHYSHVAPAPPVPLNQHGVPMNVPKSETGQASGKRPAPHAGAKPTAASSSSSSRGEPQEGKRHERESRAQGPGGHSDSRNSRAGDGDQRNAPLRQPYGQRARDSKPPRPARNQPDKPDSATAVKKNDRAPSGRKTGVMKEKIEAVDFGVKSFADLQKDRATKQNPAPSPAPTPSSTSVQSTSSSVSVSSSTPSTGSRPPPSKPTPTPTPVVAPASKAAAPSKPVVPPTTKPTAPVVAPVTAPAAAAPATNPGAGQKRKVESRPSSTAVAAQGPPSKIAKTVAAPASAPAPAAPAPSSAPLGSLDELPEEPAVDIDNLDDVSSISGISDLSNVSGASELSDGFLDTI